MTFGTGPVVRVVETGKTSGSAWLSSRWARKRELGGSNIRPGYPNLQSVALSQLRTIICHEAAP